MMTTGLLIPISEGGDVAPFFVVPSGGATPLSMVRLARTLDPGRTVYSFVPAGLDDTREPHQSIREMASAYVTEIKSAQPSGAYFVGGHCFGGTVAFEMASQLEARGDAVGLVVVIEAVPPRSEMAPEGPNGDERSDPSSLLGSEIKRFIDLTFAQMGQQLSRLPPKHANRLKDYTVKQLQLDVEYCATHPIAAPILLLRTATHHDVVFKDWSCFTTGGFRGSTVPGDTFSMLDRPHVGALARELGNALAGS
jgi:thioesterase domain-containing protein